MTVIGKKRCPLFRFASHSCKMDRTIQQKGRAQHVGIDQHSDHFLVVVLVLYLVNRLPLDGRTKQIVQAIVIIIGILSLLRYLAVF